MGDQAPRKIVFIDKKFQTNFILRFLGLLLAGTAVFNLAAYFILNRRLEDSLYSAHMTLRSVGEILLPTLVSLSVVFLVLLGAAVLLMTLFVSHLIAGPLYAIRRYIERVGEGELDFDPRLRSKDQTTPLALALSETLDVLNERLAKIQSTARELQDLSQLPSEENGEQQAAGEDPASRKASRIAALSTDILDSAEFFKTRSGVPRP